MTSQLPTRPPNLQPTQLPRFGGVPPSNDGVPTTPPRPPGLNKPPLVTRLYPDGVPIPGDESLRRQALGQDTITRQQLIWMAVVLFPLIVLLFIYDPLAVIVDVESAKQHASNEDAILAFEKEKTEREREIMARERELWEKAKEARIPRNAFWDVVWPAWDCLAYGKRDYWGVLQNIPGDWDAIDACMSMPVEIRGVKVRHPDRCARVFTFPWFQIRGYWTVDWDQPDCKPWLRDFEDKGCTGYNSGKREIRAEIVGINDKGGQDWKLLCNSTPLVWDTVTYESPSRCEARSWGKKVAMWEVPDESCKS